jgi:hypothetical protein
MKLTTDTVRELLDYDPDTGVFTWLGRGWFWFSTEGSYKLWNTKFAGKEAGCIYTDAWGYPRRKIKVLDHQPLASRLAFVWMGEPLPEQVEHVDRDSLNNRWLNLAPSSQAENGRNQSMHRNNSSGVNGVYWHKATGKWLAQVGLNGKCRHLGMFDDIDEAATAVAAFYAANGFSDGHGQEHAGYAVQ